ncbi:glycosyltransferase [bacterium]|nr:glycosyltransferase [bacterium]
MERSLCLNMIVRNESHIVVRTLENLLEKIPQIDYYVISDTGSTDDTIGLIRGFFDGRSIPGEIYEDAWVDFGHNRTVALRRAYRRTRFVLVFDADDEITGTIPLPDLRTIDDIDGFLFRFGGDTAVTYYCRLLLVSNRLRWRYRGILHEFIECEDVKEPRIAFLGGFYSVVSGRTGWRNTFPDKYARDAALLEEALLTETDPVLSRRYTFYCAQSWFDAGNHEEAERWYRKTVETEGWDQERYFSCLRLWMLAVARGAVEESLSWLVRSSEIDPERLDGVFELVRYHTEKGMFRIAWGYYEGFLRRVFENSQENAPDKPEKLFVNPWVAQFGLPYYVILLCEKTGDRDTARRMYHKIFRARFPEKDDQRIRSLLDHLEPCFTEDLRDPLLGWLAALRAAGVPIDDGIDRRYGYDVLLYTGWAPFPWNGDTPRTRALGGSETMAAGLAVALSAQQHSVVVVGNVLDTVGSPRYLHEERARDVVLGCRFRLLIVSRDLTFLDRFRGIHAEKTIVWAHDVDVLGGHHLAAPISAYVFVSEWQKRLFLERYASLPRDRCVVVPNAIDDFRPVVSTRVANRFVYSSCVNRGLEKILDLWPIILATIPDATLWVATYNTFPRNPWEETLRERMTALDGVRMLGQLAKPELYKILATCEFWLYPTTFLETFCITAVEMMAHGVLCIYYPVAALPETIGEGCGVPVEMGHEVETILTLTAKRKEEIRRAAYDRYRERFLWKDWAGDWARVLENAKPQQRIKVFYAGDARPSTDLQAEPMPTVDGTRLCETPYLARVFRDGNGPRPEILAHLVLWRRLRLDSAFDTYVIDTAPGSYTLTKKEAVVLLHRARAEGIADLSGFVQGRAGAAPEKQATVGIISATVRAENTGGLRIIAFTDQDEPPEGGRRYDDEAGLNALLSSEGVDLLYTNSTSNPFRAVDACPIMFARDHASVLDIGALRKVFHDVFAQG